LIDSVIDSSFAYTADTGCDWLKPLNVSRLFWLKQNSFETVLFQFYFSLISIVRTVLRVLCANVTAVESELVQCRCWSPCCQL